MKGDRKKLRIIIGKLGPPKKDIRPNYSPHFKFLRVFSGIEQDEFQVF